MTYQNARQVVEAAIPPIILSSLCETVKPEEHDTEEEKKNFKELCEAAFAAALAPFAKEPDPNKAVKLSNRARRVAVALVEAMVPEGTLTGKVFLTWHALTEQLIQEGLWDADPEGDFAKAFNLFNEILLEKHPDQYKSPKLNASAEKQAKRWRMNLINQGYFHHREAA